MARTINYKNIMPLEIAIKTNYAKQHTYEYIN